MSSGAWMEALEPRRMLSAVVASAAGGGAAIAAGNAGVDGGGILASSSGQYHSALNDRRFVNQLYLDLMDRRPTTPEMSNAIASLAGGTSAQSVAQSLTNTTQYHEQVVRGLYQTLLRREPVAGEESGYVSQLDSGGSVADVRTSLVASDEYFANECGGDLTRFVQSSFQDLIGRPPDATELSAYLTALNDHSTTRDGVAQSLAMSDPGRTAWIQSSFEHLLHRSPTASEVTDKLGELHSSTSEATVLSEIAGTQEYYVGASTGVIVTGTQAGAPPNVRVFNAMTGGLELSFMAYDPGYLGGVRVAGADVNGDGIPDIITAPGPGAPPNVRVFDGTTGEPLAGPLGSFFAYDPGFLGGVQVAAGDVNADGHADIITGVDAQPNAGPNVRVFSGADGSMLRSFWAYDPGFHGGVRVAAGDVNGDGYADIITGPAAATSNVKVFDGRDNSVIASFFAYEPNDNAGVYVTSGDINADGHDDIVVSRGAGQPPQVTTFSGATFQIIHQYNAYDPAFLGGVTLGAVDANIDGYDDVVSGAGPGADPHVKVCDCSIEVEYENFEAYDVSYAGGIYVAGGRRFA